MQRDVTNRVAILVVSCDNYSDLWAPFFECFKLFWPDCPFNVYLLSNEKACDRAGVKNVLTGEDLSWSDSLIKGVSQLKEDYVFMFLDDLFLVKPVDTKKVIEVFDWAVQDNVNYIGMYPMANSKPDRAYNRLVGLVSKKAVYRASTVMAVWKKEVLLDLLRPGESAWAFEINGTVRSDKYDHFYVTWQSYFSIVNTVIKGKWRRCAVKKMKKLGIKTGLNSRQVMTLGETAVLRLKLLRSRLLSLLPVKHRRKIRSFLLGKKDVYLGEKV